MLKHSGVTKGNSGTADKGNIDFLPNRTIVDWKKWQERCELIKGIPYLRNDEIDTKHQAISKLIVEQLSDHLKQFASYEIVEARSLFVDYHTVLIPDISVQKKRSTVNGSKQNIPNLVIEISSPISELKDKNIKPAYYEEKAIPYYMIVNPSLQCFQVFKRHLGKYRLMTESPDQQFLIKLSKSEHIKLDLSGLWQDIKKAR